MKKGTLLIAILAVTLFTGCGNRNTSNEEDISSLKEQINELQQQIEALPNDSATIADIDKKIDNLQNERDDSGTQISEYKSQNEELTQKNTELEAQIAELQQSGGYEVFINIVFPSDGNTYVINPEQTDLAVYSDTTCTAKLEKLPEIATREYVDAYAENGLKIYCYRTVNDRIVYTTRSLDLKEK